MRFEAALDLVWSWTPIMPAVLLEQGTTFQVNLSTSKPCPNAYVLLMGGKQKSSIFPLTSNSYIAASWRASLAEPVNASFQVWSTEPQSLGIFSVESTQPVHLKGYVSFEGLSGHQLPPEELVNLEVARILCLASTATLVALVLLVTFRRVWRSRLHLAFFACFLLKALVLLLLVWDLLVTDATGRQSLLRAASWQMLRHAQETSVIGLFFLVGLGWKITRSSLRSSEWTFSLVALGLSLLLRGMEVLCSALRVCSPQRYLLTLFTVNSLCSLVIIVSTNFNIFLLGRQLLDVHATQEAAVVYAKLHAYMSFRICYLYFIMIPVVCGAALRLVSWRAMWMVKEVLEWLVLSAVLYLWRPGYVKAIRVFELTENAVFSDSEDTPQED